MAQATPNRLENLHSLRSANYDAGFATIFGALVSGAFLTGLIDHLGGNDFIINLAAALPALCGLLQIPGGILGRRFQSFKWFVAPGGTGWRLLYIPFIFVLFLPVPNQVKIGIILACITLAAASSAMIGPAYNEWLAEMVPSTSRGFFFSRRNAMFAAIGAIAGLLGGFCLDFFKQQNQIEIGFSTIFGFGVLCGLISLVFYMRMHDLPRAHVSRIPLGEALKELKNPLVDRNFRSVLLFLSIFVIGQAFAGNLFAAFAIKSLHLPYSIIQWAGVMHALGNVLAARFWGYLADRYGNKPVLYMVGAGLSITPTMWLFCQPDDPVRNALILLPIHVLVGATWAGVALCQYNLLLATAKPEERANYLSVSLTVQSVVGFVSPMIGAQVLEIFGSRMDQADAYKAVFGVTMVLRAFAIFLLLPVREEGALQVRRALRDISRLTPRGIKAMRGLHTTDIGAREQAIENLAAQRTTLAADAVIRALHDPSPRIRRQAAAALSRMEDPEAVPALLHMFEDHPDLIDEEAIEALGLLGDSRAVPALIGMLQSPVAMLRRASAKALGRIGDPGAIDALIEVAGVANDPDLRRSALQALRNLEAVQADLVIADALFDPAPSVRIAAAEAVSELQLERALPYVRQSLHYYDDEAASEVAYALGTIGKPEDLSQILREATECHSVITRRRCLLGVSRILGIESDVYRLFMIEGMARDQYLMVRLSTSLKSCKVLQAALSQYSSGRETEAIQLLCSSPNYSDLKVFADHPVEDLFLVAAAYISKG